MITLVCLYGGHSDCRGCGCECHRIEEEKAMKKPEQDIMGQIEQILEAEHIEHTDSTEYLSCPAARHAALEGSTEGLLSVEHCDVTINGKLCCPLCEQEWSDGRGSYLHQYGVEAFFRDEDAQEGVHGYIADTDSSIDVAGNCGDTSRNPSSRRDGMIIYFQCEWHGWEIDDRPEDIVLELHIAQHKGDTGMYWLVKRYALPTSEKAGKRE